MKSVTYDETQWRLVPVDRSYDMRVKSILAFNTAEQAGQDRDDALDAAFRAELDAAPNPSADWIPFGLKWSDFPPLPDCCEKGPRCGNPLCDETGGQHQLDTQAIRDAALEEAAHACERQERLRDRKDAKAVCRLCARDIRALKSHPASQTCGDSGWIAGGPCYREPDESAEPNPDHSQDREDAQRYRAVRDAATNSYGAFLDLMKGYGEKHFQYFLKPTAAEFDAAIDAARATKESK